MLGGSELETARPEDGRAPGRRSPSPGLQPGPDLAGHECVRVEHARGRHAARAVDQEMLDAGLLIRSEPVGTGVRVAGQLPLLDVAGGLAARWVRQDAQRDGDLRRLATVPGELLMEVGSVALQLVDRDPERLPPIAELGGAPDRAPAVSADPDREAAWAGWL